MVTLAIYLAGPIFVAVVHLGLKLDLAIVFAFAFAAALVGIAMAASQTNRSMRLYPIPQRSSKHKSE